MQKIDIVEQNLADLSIDLLKILLKDKTTKKNIVWATNDYSDLGAAYQPSQEILPNLITGINTNVIQPRVSKSPEEQLRRTRDKAEVFTPSWVCNLQNNLVDTAWFGYESPFNKELDNAWEVKAEPISFPEEKTWKDYVDAKRLEITCGEAPYLVSRYDTVTGNLIPVNGRIGLLDRKLRVISENTTTFDEWYTWTIRAFEATYGYDYQGDNVLLARENLLYTFIDYYQDKFQKEPELSQLKKIAGIISWNIWQMDGLTFTTPYSAAPPIYQQTSLFDLLGETTEEEFEPIPTRIFDWRSNTSLEFKTIK